MQANRRSGKTVVIVIVVIAGVMLLLCGGVLAAILMPAVTQARAAAQRQVSMNNMKSIAIALHNYHDTYRAFPPAYLEGEDGEPIVSWRVLLVPFLSEDFRATHGREIDWTDPQNKGIPQQYEGLYTSPHVSQARVTPYIAVVGPKTVFTTDRRMRFADVTDGTSNTIFFIEDVNHPVPWDAPQDVTIEEFLARYDAEDFPAQGFLAALVDGSVRMIPLGRREIIENLLDRSDGQVMPEY